MIIDVFLISIAIISLIFTNMLSRVFEVSFNLFPVKIPNLIYIFLFSLPNTVLVKLPSGEIVKKTTTKQGQLEVTKVPKPTTSASALAQKLKLEQRGEKKEVNILNISYKSPSIRFYFYVLT